MFREEPNKLPKRCEKCRFFAKVGVHEICDYINIMNEPRIDPVSKTCTKYERKRVKK